MKWRLDKAWSDKFIPTIKQIVGPYLLSESTLEQDTQEAADLVILRARDLTIACRIRRPGYASKYPDQFTLRSRRDSGTKTELAKMVEGWGDWMFYGHSTQSETGITPWWLIDLSAWRAQLIMHRSEIRYEKIPNGDGTHFTAFHLKSFRPSPPILIGCSPEPKELIQHAAPIDSGQAAWKAKVKAAFSPKPNNEFNQHMQALRQ